METVFIKRILEGFSADTKVEVWYGEDLYNEYGTVGDVMKSGLLTYSEIVKGTLLVQDDTIVIDLVECH